ncbi:TIGR02234 family membrane protein [Mycolicibacterium sp. NCC-Tsukiji]|uniref:TIGR02234 family membrane protein n=1 Tax=Mycolicibacterium sp. NCC-Tsukiji TaxID=2185272 RepID=UPI000ECB1997|nr:TIGR02234 family membrane protein [Mycolicibacterium sp. NCC-Tsukiji]GCB01463.1 membrane protein [Mycolicibacterium sp. NCC-Tsukiji]
MRTTRTAQVLLLVAALMLWGASRLPWVDVSSFDGLGQPKTTTLSGAAWSTALIPLALLAGAAAVAALAVRGWALRLLALLVAVASAGMGYLAISLWAVTDVSVRAADMAQIAVMFLVGTQRHYWGAGVTLAAAVLTLVGAVLLMRSAGRNAAAPTTSKYAAPGARREAAQEQGADGMSERMMWDALDEGHDPTRNEGPDPSQNDGGGK